MSKQTRKILMGILIAVIIIAFIELLFKLPGFIKRINDYDRKPISNSEKDTSINTNNTKKGINVDKNVLSLKISNFIDKITYKKYQDAYNLLDADYKALFYPNLKKFVDINSQHYKNDKTVSIEYFDRVKENQYVCRATISNLNIYKMNDEGPIEEYFTVNILGDNGYTIAPKGFLYTRTVNYHTKVGEIDIKVIRIDRYFNKTYISLAAHNGEGVPITMIDDKSSDSLGNVKLSASEAISGPQNLGFFNEGKYILPQLKAPIPSGSSANFYIPFTIAYQRDLTKLTLNNIMVGKEVRTAKIDFK